MKNWPLAWAAGLTLAWLARRFSSSALPDPGPLPALDQHSRLRLILQHPRREAVIRQRHGTS